MEWFQKGCSLSLVLFTKKSRKLLPELRCTASRDKPPEKKKFRRKILFPRLRMFHFYLRNLQIAAFCILMSYFMKSKLKKISVDSW